MIAHLNIFLIRAKCGHQTIKIHIFKVPIEINFSSKSDEIIKIVKEKCSDKTDFLKSGGNGLGLRVSAASERFNSPKSTPDGFGCFSVNSRSDVGPEVQD